MKTYKIVGRTNSWIAQRDIRFNGRTEIVLEEGLTLKEAQDKLFKMYLATNGDSRATNWGLAVIESKRGIWGAGSHKDGTRYFNFDSRTYCIEEE